MKYLLLVGCIVAVLTLPLLGCGDDDKDKSSTTETQGDAGSHSDLEPDLDIDSEAYPPLDIKTDLDLGNYDEVAGYSAEIKVGNRRDATDIYYPVLSESHDEVASFPIALFLQGANVDRKYYSDFATILASYGFIVVVPNHTMAMLGTNGLYPETSQVQAVLNHMEGDNTTEDSPVFTKVDLNKLAIMGHSFGGMAAQTVIQNKRKELKAGALWGAGSGTINNGNVAVAIVVGTMDEGVNNPIPFGNSDLKESAKSAYENTRNPPKALIEVVGANHFGQCNVNNPKGALAADGPDPTLIQAVAVETIARWHGMFFRAHVLGDEDAIQYVYAEGDVEDENVNVTAQLE